MNREEVQKLLGGYATGTLTADEQQALFAAALEDQELFDALVREQGLRDLLRDPAAKAKLLAALDERPARGVWAWMRRPWVAGLAMAGVAAMAVAVWVGGRGAGQKVQQTSIASPGSEVEDRVAAVPAPQAPAAAVRGGPANGPVASARRKFTPPAELSRDTKEKVEVTAEAPVVAETKLTAELKVRSDAVAAPAPPQQQELKRLQDARAMLNEPQVAAGRNAFVAETAAPGGGGGGSAQPSAKKASAVAMGALAGAVSLPGMRCSILRRDKETELGTPLDLGESVKLRVIPNSDGFLTVIENGAVVASGQVKRQVAFETPALKSDVPVQRQFRVILTPGPSGRGNAVAAMPVTLTWQ